MKRRKISNIEMAIRISDFKQTDLTINNRSIGSWMHYEYNLQHEPEPRKSLLLSLQQNKPFYRLIGNHVLTGVPDDYETDGRSVSLVEVFTTSKKVYKLNKKKLQLQMYIWLMEPILNSLGYTLAEFHWLVVYDQSTRNQLERIGIKRRDDIEDVILRRLQ